MRALSCGRLKFIQITRLRQVKVHGPIDETAHSGQTLLWVHRGLLLRRQRYLYVGRRRLLDDSIASSLFREQLLLDLLKFLAISRIEAGSIVSVVQSGEQLLQILIIIAILAHEVELISDRQAALWVTIVECRLLRTLQHLADVTLLLLQGRVSRLDALVLGQCNRVHHHSLQVGFLLGALFFGDLLWNHCLHVTIVVGFWCMIFTARLESRSAISVLALNVEAA